ncbi:hypothetical protein TPB0596_12010 [Tsukamurella pulmonis]|uniref:hypothetical protein n=1 Tax=Tsukamurella pulmonis TaxID=47312 RepID=UPI001EDE8964|nr:hypothetical protein [Tsukamurella pulmonis]BDD81438.1 hypothetical protein TPB0596_12010 [Tsukamurella pulmonis]
MTPAEHFAEAERLTTAAAALDAEAEALAQRSALARIAGDRERALVLQAEERPLSRRARRAREDALIHATLALYREPYEARAVRDA